MGEGAGDGVDLARTACRPIAQLVAAVLDHLRQIPIRVHHSGRSGRAQLRERDGSTALHEVGVVDLLQLGDDRRDERPHAPFDVQIRVFGVHALSGTATERRAFSFDALETVINTKPSRRSSFALCLRSGSK